MSASGRPTLGIARIWAVFPLLLLMTATVACDRVTKHAAAVTLKESPGRSFLADTVRLQYAENTGAFLGLGAQWPRPVRTGFFVVGNAVLLTGLVLVAMRQARSRVILVGLALFVAGGASNLADRVTRGSVIDFMSVGSGPLRTGIFNVADAAIMLGAGLVLGDNTGRRRTPPPKP
jgi:signal peptidase II